MYPQSIIDRFWSKVDIGFPDQCWEWQASRREKGYGQLWDGKFNWRSHRFVYTLEHGTIPDGMFVLHKCDNPACCNPRHLYLGTAQDNSTDMKRRNPNHKRNVTRAHRDASPLNWSIVKDIRSSDLSPRVLSEKYGVSTDCIYGVLANKSWAD